MKIAVVGGGISGISIAALLKKHTDYDVVLIEKSKNIGGKASSIKENGYLIEKGPNGFLDNKLEIKQLIEEFGFENNVIESNDASRRRFIYSNAKLYELPSNPTKLLLGDFFSTKAKLRIFKEPFIKPNFEDETLEHFVIRRLGKEMLDKVIGPMACGVYAGNPKNMSMDATFKRIKEIERQYGSLIKGLVKLMKQKKATASSTAGSFSAKLMSFKDGVGSFIEHLSKGINTIHDEVLSLEKSNNRYTLILKNETICADSVIFAIPSYALSSIIKNIDEEFSEKLREIGYAPLNVVSLGFDKKDMPNVTNSFGYLFNLNDIEDTIGVLFDSSIFNFRADKDKLLVRLMIGGAMKQESAKKKNIIEIAIKELQRSAKIYQPFNFSHIEKHQKAIPQYGLNHKQILKEKDDFEANHKGIFITGNAFNGVSLNDCVKSSYEVLSKIK